MSNSQPFPEMGVLSANLNWRKSKLKAQLAQASGGVYSYVVKTVAIDREQKQFQQRGSAPNFQGDYITLCTCKHQMRSRLAAVEWPDKWVAGLTSRTHNGFHWLFYLAQVECAFESHSELWDAIPSKTRQAKSAKLCRFGDLYEPRRALRRDDCFDPAYYHTPISKHAHHRHACDNKWQNDIDYRRKTGKRPKQVASLLVCHPPLSFLWESPTIRLKEDHVRDYQRWDNLDEFLGKLESSR